MCHIPSTVLKTSAARSFSDDSIRDQDLYFTVINVSLNVSLNGDGTGDFLFFLRYHRFFGLLLMHHSANLPTKSLYFFFF